MFEGQRPDEKIILSLRKHPAVLFLPGFWLAILTLLPVAAFIYFKFSWVFSAAFFFWLLFGVFYLFKTWYCYRNSQYILTTERLIKFDQKGVFHKAVSESPLEKIQDVSHEIKGFWPSMWDFGTVYIQTAGGQEKIALECVEEPRRIQERLLRKDHKEEQGKVEDKNHKEKQREAKRSKEEDFWS